MTTHKRMVLLRYWHLLEGDIAIFKRDFRWYDNIEFAIRAQKLVKMRPNLQKEPSLYEKKIDTTLFIQFKRAIFHLEKRYPQLLGQKPREMDITCQKEGFYREKKGYNILWLHWVLWHLSVRGRGEWRSIFLYKKLVPKVMTHPPHSVILTLCVTKIDMWETPNSQKGHFFIWKRGTHSCLAKNQGKWI